MSEGRLVYSTDSPGVNLGKAGKNLGKAKGSGLVEVVPASTTLRLQYEKKGRGGKGVSLVLDLPENPPYCKRLMKEIKAQLATGGAYKEADASGMAHLEFQGNCLDRLRDVLTEKGFAIKG